MSELTVVGSGKIELFDALTLRKVEEVPFTNYVSSMATAYDSWKTRQEYRTSHPNTQADAAPTNALTHITLNTDARTEAGETDFQGTVIGWANKTAYSGTDVYRGTPNTAESEATPTRVTWVFDWPTHAAVGTFRSLTWTSLNESTRAGTGIGARALLAADVTKPNNKTLKVTYVFDFV